jgi:hypothetical protein
MSGDVDVGLHRANIARTSLDFKGADDVKPLVIEPCCFEATVLEADFGFGKGETAHLRCVYYSRCVYR